MSNQFKAGDLALVIDSVDPVDIGRVGTILAVYVDDSFEYRFIGEVHEGHASGKPAALLDLVASLGGIWSFDQEQLMLLRGDFAPTVEKSMAVPV